MRCTRLLSPAYHAGRRRTRRTEAVILPRLGTVPQRARCGAYRKRRTRCHAFVQPPAPFFANCLRIRRCSPPIQGRIPPIQRPPGAPAARSACVFAGGRVGSLGSDTRPPPISSDRSLMRLSRYFMPTLRETPREAEIVSHRLMLRAGLIRQQPAGSFSWLPLGLRVLNKINRIVREEQDRSGAIEVKMPTIQSADLWRESGRYDAYGKEMLRITDRHEREMLYGPTNEEMVTDIFRSYVTSYRALPLNLYHIQWKFRDEVRPRFGVMRGREFLMKDAYSFDFDAAGARRSYDKMFVAYLRTFSRMGLTAIPMRAETGPIGGDLSHEFLVLADTGESGVYCDSRILDLPVPPEDVDYDGDLRPLIEPWTKYYAATEDV